MIHICLDWNESKQKDIIPLSEAVNESHSFLVPPKMSSRDKGTLKQQAQLSRLPSPYRHHTVHFNSICLLFSSHGLSLLCHSFFPFLSISLLSFSLLPTMYLSFCIFLHVSLLHKEGWEGGTKTMTERGGWVVEITC